MAETWKNQLYYGDNLRILRDYVQAESVDHIYLDRAAKSTRRKPEQFCLGSEDD